MAALIYFYGKEISKHPHPLKDDPKNISFFNEIWKDNNVKKVVTETLSNTELWGQNLAEISPLKEKLTQAINAIASHQRISQAHQAYKNLQL
jgi:mannitol-1-phosphate/altronate dehydrogenase